MKNYLLFLFLLNYGISIAQSPHLSKIIPPSPNASSLAQYADVPVSNYTGVPNISIPLISVKSGKIEVPISASYHGSGIKVAEEASWIGLGWSLNAGGVITRQTRGLDDFHYQGGYIRTELPPATSQNLPDWTGNNFDKYYSTYTSVQYGDLDGEPDVFYYNFLQYSGKLVFEKQFGDIVKAVSIDQNNLVFSYNIISKIWTVTDGNGWQYYFGSSSLNAIETTASHSTSSTIPIEPTNDRISQYDPDTFDSAWYITKVVTPEGDTVNFQYENSGKTISQISRNEQIKDFLNTSSEINGQYAYRYINTPARSSLYSASMQVINPVYLKKIIFNNGYVEFITEDRTDIRTFSTSDPNPKRLKATKLYNLSGKLVKQFDFNYSYFGSSISSGNSVPIVDNEQRFSRLKLESIQESTLDNNNQSIKNPPYVFTYNSTLLPEKTSYSLDYWGYSNGQPNNAVGDYKFINLSMQDRIALTDRGFATASKILAPFYESTTGSNIYLYGANREVNSGNLKAAVLQSIKYPTGGVVNFEYEPNNYYTDRETLYEYQPVTESALMNGRTGKHVQQSFTLTHLTKVQLYFYIYNLSSQVLDNRMTAALEDQNGNKLIYAAPWSTSTPNPTPGSFYSYLTVFLPAGTYNLRVKNDSNETLVMEANVKYIKKIQTNKKLGAGLRIASITTYDQNEIVKQKKFDYTANNFSTGRLISPYQFFHNETLVSSVYVVTAAYPIFQQVNNYLVRTSDSAIPYGNSAQGSIIGYNQVNVTEYDKNTGDNITSKYFYKNTPEIPIELFLPGVPNQINLSNGQLLHEENYNKNNIKVKESTIDYYRENTAKKIKGLKMFGDTGSTTNSIRFYDVLSEWWHQKSNTEIIYDTNGANPITTITNFKYSNSNHKNLTETQSLNSKGQTLKTILQYPSDLLNGIDETTSPTISSMISNNVLNPVLKTETKVNDITTQSIITNYGVKTHSESNSSNNMYLPTNIKVKKGSSNYEEAIQYNSYDNNGYILQQQKTNGTPISFIWGYKNEFPIAKIENALYSDVSSYVSNIQTKSDTGTEAELITALDALRAALPNAMVTTYTYIPLVGVSTITDPKGDITTYTYDNFGRLEFVKDNKGNILTENQYHYKP